MNEQRLRHLERKDKARDLCEAAGFAPEKEFLELLLDTRTDAGMAKLVEREKKARAAAASPNQRNRPRSGVTNLTEGANGSGSGGSDLIENRMAALRSRD